MNSTHIQRKIEDSQKLERLFHSVGDRNLGEVTIMLYLTILSRFPTQDDTKAIAEYAESAPSKCDAMVDLAWALISSDEFFYRH